MECRLKSAAAPCCICVYSMIQENSNYPTRVFAIPSVVIHRSMFRIFRRFREKLIRDGKAKSYVTYALGETVLIVIGILIALQINNWNGYRQERKQEKSALLEIKNSMLIDIENIDHNLALQKSLLQLPIILSMPITVGAR